MTAVALASSHAELAAARSAMTGTVAVVMTMGALHTGHASLLHAARSRADAVIATIFVNPLQFGPNEDFDRYPRTLEADLKICEQERVDLVFAPSKEAMYPFGEPAVRIDPGPLAQVLEGASRPGHFAGALTVVLKLLHLTRANLALFGEKDYQQLTLIRAMVADLDLPVEVVGVPTVRESDGLAMSSRNRYLSASERSSATVLSRALAAGQAAAGRGAEAVLEAASAVIASDPAVRLEYLRLTDPALHPLDPADADADADAADAEADARARARAGAGRAARLLVAARVGETRLIDNAALEIG